MQSSRIITLFHNTPLPPGGPPAYIFSVILHEIIFGLLIIGLRHSPNVYVKPWSERYTVRILNLDSKRPELTPVDYHPGQPALRTEGYRAAGHGPAAPTSHPQIAKLPPGHRTLVQPEAPASVVLPEDTPIPTVVLWSPEDTRVAKTVPPPAQAEVARNLQPSLNAPNHEMKLADLSIAASPVQAEIALAPSATTSPMVVDNRALKPGAATVPQTTSQSTDPATAARILSLSDIQMRQGAAALPMAQQTAMLEGMPGPMRQGGNGSGPMQGASDANTSLGAGNGLSSIRIALPKDGHFGYVVVGSLLEEQYPEMVGIWGGRMAYTVYLHVGLPKTWLLQYALPPEVEAASAGHAVRPDAPWPYVMVRPHLASGDWNADVVMVHGFVNTAGHFEKLAVVFPPDFTQSSFVVDTLEQWEFRPATQNGQAATVEVLLIIPNQE